LFDVSPTGNGVFITDRHITSDRRLRIYQISYSGDTVSTTIVALRAVPLGDVEVKTVVDSIERALRARPAWASVTPEQLRHTIQRSLYTPPLTTPVDRSLPTPQGTLWLRGMKRGSPNQDWYHITPGQTAITRLRLSSSEELIAAAEMVIWTLEEREPQSILRSYRLIRGERCAY
jgi:hypothetical protein